MKVWIVTYDYGPPYGRSNQKIFDSEEKARAYIERIAVTSYDYDIEEFEVE